MCDDEVVALTPKAFAVLRRLVEDGGQLVTKEELLRAGWANTHVTDGVLKVSILEIRRALGDDSAAPRFIETVPRRGYRFIAPRTRTATIATSADRGAVSWSAATGCSRSSSSGSSARAADERQLVFLSGEAGIGKTTVARRVSGARGGRSGPVDRDRRVPGALRRSGGRTCRFSRPSGGFSARPAPNG